MAARKPSVWRTWAADGLQSNIGRLLMMIPGAGVIGYAGYEFRPMSDSEFRTSYGSGSALLVAGYLAPSIKRFVVSKAGVEIETHDRKSAEDSREAATELTEEVESQGGAEIEPDEATEGARFFAANAAMSAILGSENFGGAELYVYLMDDKEGGLLPAFGLTERLTEQPAWKPGVGAVGKAFVSKASVVAVGPEAHDSTHGLNDTQQAQHSTTSAVIASPILNANGSVIGVVTASEHDRPVDDCYLASQEALDRLVAAADACARILIDLLGWFADDV